MKQPPWHLWGVSQTLTAGGVSPNPTTQLVKASSKIPVSWSFLFWCQVQSLAGTVPASVEARFDVTCGVGRSYYTIQFFAVLVPQLAGANSPDPGAFAWTSVVSPIGSRVISVGPPVDPGFLQIDRLTASDIQIQGFYFALGGDATTVSVAEVGAQVAPIAHVRPDWFVEHFDGEELGGK